MLNAEINKTKQLQTEIEELKSSEERQKKNYKKIRNDQRVKKFIK